MMEEKNKIEWTKEQEKIIEEMIKESENIGYVQGRDDMLREIIEELKRRFIRGGYDKTN